jgi:hypothetical protein
VRDRIREEGQRDEEEDEEEVKFTPTNPDDFAEKL